MLVLSRKVNETIEIGGGITLLVIRIQGDQVRLGFEAPRHVTINRGEVQERMAGKEVGKEVGS